MDYKDQIIAIRNKITSVSETATAEELVYLAGALDKIAEKATIVDIVDAGTDATNQVEAKRVQSLEDLEDFANGEFKTINGVDIIGSGNIEVQPTLVNGVSIKMINGISILGGGNMEVAASGSVSEKLIDTYRRDFKTSILLQRNGLL